MLMRIGWRAYIRQKMRKASPHFAIGVALYDDSASFCLLNRDSQHVISLVRESVTSRQNWAQQLAKWVDKHDLEGTPTYVAVSVDLYELVQVDRPGVNDTEMLNALKWSVNEVIPTDTPHTYDYFDLPVPLAGSKKVNVVAIDTAIVESIVKACFDADLELQNISAEELVTCNFDMKTDLPVLTLIQDMHNEVCLNIVKDGVLYFSRRLKGFDNLASFSPDELQMGIVDSLCVQIQRSMDYFEAQLRQAPVRQILIKLDTPHLETLKTQIQQAVPATVSLMSVNIDVPEQYNPLGVSYTAIGAALAAAKTVPAEGAQ